MNRKLALIIATLMVLATALPAQAMVAINGTGDNGVDASGVRLLAIEIPSQTE